MGCKSVRQYALQIPSSSPMGDSNASSGADWRFPGPPYRYRRRESTHPQDVEDGMAWFLYSWCPEASAFPVDPFTSSIRCIAVSNTSLRRCRHVFISPNQVLHFAVIAVSPG